MRAALGAEDVLVAAQQRGSHRARGNHEGFGLERLEQKRQDERDDDRLDRFTHAEGRAAAGSGRRVLALATASWGFAGSDRSPFAFVVVAIVFPD